MTRFIRKLWRRYRHGRVSETYGGKGPFYFQGVDRCCSAMMVNSLYYPFVDGDPLKKFIQSYKDALYLHWYNIIFIDNPGGAGERLAEILKPYGQVKVTKGKSCHEFGPLDFYLWIPDYDFADKFRKYLEEHK